MSFFLPSVRGSPNSDSFEFSSFGKLSSVEGEERDRLWIGQAFHFRFRPQLNRDRLEKSCLIHIIFAFSSGESSSPGFCFTSCINALSVSFSDFGLAKQQAFEAVRKIICCFSPLSSTSLIPQWIAHPPLKIRANLSQCVRWEASSSSH